MRLLIFAIVFIAFSLIYMIFFYSKISKPFVPKDPAARPSPNSQTSVEPQVKSMAPAVVIKPEPPKKTNTEKNLTASPKIIHWTSEGKYKFGLKNPQEALKRFPEMIDQDPQADKYVYMFQTYVAKKNGGKYIYPKNDPAEQNYTGKWQHWDREGRLKMVEFYESGKSKEWKRYYDSGALKEEFEWNGFFRTYDELGQLKSESIMPNTK